MAYKYNYINKLDQFDYVAYSLILVDDQGIMPDVRIEKCFTFDKFPNVNDQFLNAQAQQDIDLYTQMYLDQL